MNAIWESSYKRVLNTWVYYTLWGGEREGQGDCPEVKVDTVMNHWLPALFHRMNSAIAMRLNVF